jgi:hypothetical protein
MRLATWPERALNLGGDLPLSRSIFLVSTADILLAVSERKCRKNRVAER